MKKILLLLVAMALMPVALQAQLLNAPQANGLLQRVNALQSFDTRHKAPAQMDLPANQKILGHYDTDEVETGGFLGLTGFPGVIPTAIELTPDELAMFQGGKIVAFRVGMASSTPITRVFAAPSTETGFGDFTEWTCNANAEGWNVIPVDPPYEINLDENTGLFVGFDYRQTSSNYPISAVMAGNISPTYMYINYQGSLAWYDLGLEAYGNLSLQVIVESDNYPDYMLRVSNLTTQNFVKVGEDLDFSFKAKNGGLKEIEAGAVTFNLTIDGEDVLTMTNDGVIADDYVTLSGVVSTEGLAPGSHVLAMTPVTLNGEAIENPTTLETTFRIFTNVFPRQKHIVEQFTSTYCTWCPLGSLMLSKLTELRSDVIKVGIHGNMNGTDPFRINQCDTIMSYMGADSYPSAAFDRTVGWEDDETLVNGIGYYEEYSQMVAEELSAFFDYVSEVSPSFASINIECELEDRNAHITVSGEITPDFEEMMGPDAKLTVYLTEDSLVARQLNQGTWEPKYVHEGVFRQALRSVFGVDINKEGETYKNEFNYTIPEAWNMEKMNVIAFISRPLINGAYSYTDMYINNAEFVKLINPSVGIVETLAQDDAVPVAYYDVMGRRLNGPQQGINIVKMSNGTAKKVLVK